MRATGKLIWENRIGPRSPHLYGGNRSMALYQDRLFLATTDAHLVALDAGTGQTVWNVKLGTERHAATGGVMVIHGKVLTGLTSCASYSHEKCFISAYDADTGKEVWRFNTVAQKGEPGGDTWNGWTICSGPVAKPGSRAPTTPTSISPIGACPGQALDARQSRQQERRGALYQRHGGAGCRHGKLKWYYSHAPGEIAGSRRSVRARADRSRSPEDADDDRQGRHPVKLDRSDGKFLGYKETVLQNVFKSIDPGPAFPPIAMKS